MNPFRKPLCATLGVLAAIGAAPALAAAPVGRAMPGAIGICSQGEVRYVILPPRLLAALPRKPAPKSRHDMACAHATCVRERSVPEKGKRR